MYNDNVKLVRKHQGAVDELKPFAKVHNDNRIELTNKYNKPKKELSKEALKLLTNYHFPGNIRELKNILERAVILSKEKIIQPEDFPPPISTSFPYNMKMEIKVGSSIEEAEKELIIKTLSKVGGHREKAAEILKISLRALHYKLNKYGIREKSDSIS